MELQNRKVLITGISKGIGKELALQFLSKGCKVAGFGLTEPDYQHENLRFYRTNVRNPKEVASSYQKYFKEFDGDIDILVNNSGLGYFGKTEDYTDEQLFEMYETNVYGVFFMNRHAIPIMKKKFYGHIFNIASTAAIEGYPQVSAYCGTKFAVKGISESMYKELRDYRIKVTCVYPGSVKTDFFRNSPGIQPHDYMLMPQDVAQMIVQAAETPDNFHQVNLEVRPLQPKGPVFPEQVNR